jgi:hypothetical protein
VLDEKRATIDAVASRKNSILVHANTADNGAGGGGALLSVAELEVARASLPADTDDDDGDGDGDNDEGNGDATGGGQHVDGYRIRTQTTDDDSEIALSHLRITEAAAAAAERSILDDAPGATASRLFPSNDTILCEGFVVRSASGVSAHR